MSVSDSYIVQYLLQSTLDREPIAIWKEKDHGFRTVVRGVGVELDLVPSRTGDRVFLTFAAGEHRVHIAEPLDLGLLSSKYESEDKRELASLMRELLRGVARTCAGRHAEASADPAGSRETVFKRLLFSEEPSGAILPGETRVA